jgi:hypothetical protein
MGDLFDAPAYVADAYRDDPLSIGAALEWACVTLGLFRGVTMQRSTILAATQRRHATLNDGRTAPQQETIGRELRHREGPRQHYYDRALSKGWRIVCDDGRVWAIYEGSMAAPVQGQVANPGHGCAAGS